MGAEPCGPNPLILTCRYWGGVVDNARLAIRNDFQDLHMLWYMLQTALKEVDEALTRKGQDRDKED